MLQPYHCNKARCGGVVLGGGRKPMLTNMPFQEKQVLHFLPNERPCRAAHGLRRECSISAGALHLIAGFSTAIG